MKSLLLATALFLAGAVAGAHTYQASADTPPGAPPPPGQNMGPPPGPWGVGHHGFPGGMMDHRHDDAFSLFARVENKNLSPADVKLIAQATLLEHGNHSWTVTNVNQSGQNIDFSYATPHGDVIATFAVDPASGHMHRVS